MAGEFEFRSDDEARALVVAGLDHLLARVAGATPEELTAVTAIKRRADALQLATVGRFDALQSYEADGAASASAWLRANLRMTPGAARTAVRTARRVDELPEMKAALVAGEIGVEHVQVVTSAMSRTERRRDTIARAEPVFCDAAKKLDPAQLARVVDRWTHTVDPLGAFDQEREIHEQRYLSISRTFEGAVKLDALLSPDAGATVMTALEAMSTDEYRKGRCPDGTPTDDRTPGQRRADALEQLSRQFLDSGASPEIGGMRPHLQLTVPAASLGAEPGQLGVEPGELEGVGPVSPEAARRIGCDALIGLMGLDAAGVPVSYGRTTRKIDPRLRKMLNQRDRGCRFPGCGRPAAWAQAHHIQHWSRGGPTELWNLVLLCLFHHHLVHEGGFAITGDPQVGTLAFFRPDSTVIPDPGRDTGRTA